VGDSPYGGSLPLSQRMCMSEEYVVLVNRTQEDCEGTYDGKPYRIKPGKSEHPKHRATKFVEQNPVMGSEDPRTGKITYRLGIEEMRMDCSPLTPEFLAQYDGSIEKWDRDKLVGARPSEVVAGDNGLYSGTVSWKGQQPLGSSFTDPN
jgi:hypothetical protein